MPDGEQNNLSVVHLPILADDLWLLYCAAKANYLSSPADVADQKLVEALVRVELTIKRHRCPKH